MHLYRWLQAPRASSATSQCYKPSAECLAHDQASSLPSLCSLKSAGGAPGLHLVLICVWNFFLEKKKIKTKFPIEYMLFFFPPRFSVEGFGDRERKTTNIFFFFLPQQRRLVFFLKRDAGNTSSLRATGLRSAHLHIRMNQ